MKRGRQNFPTPFSKTHLVRNYLVTGVTYRRSDFCEMTGQVALLPIYQFMVFETVESSLQGSDKSLFSANVLSKPMCNSNNVGIIQWPWCSLPKTGKKFLSGSRMLLKF